MARISVVDLAKLPDVEDVKEDEEWISVAAKIRDGLGTVGFLYLINHGIPQDVISNVFAQSQQFFALDQEVKLKYKKDTTLDSNDENSKAYSLEKYFGYTPQGGERLHPDAKFELKETFDWLDRRGTYPDAELPNFESSIAKLDSECKNLLKKLLKLLAISLELDDMDFFVKCCKHFDQPELGVYNMRLLHYPSLENADVGLANRDKGVRLGAHTDYGFLTLLFQDNAGGLEVQNVDGEWLEAKPMEGSILINTGDLTEFWTCGIFPATPHRITTPEADDKKSNQSRYSVVYFNAPDSSAVITPQELEKRPKEMERLKNNGKVYSKEPIKCYEYLMSRVANQYA